MLTRCAIAITTRLVDASSTPMLLKLVESGRIRAGSLGTHSFKFEDMNKAYETFGKAAENDALKVIIEF